MVDYVHPVQNKENEGLGLHSEEPILSGNWWEKLYNETASKMAITKDKENTKKRKREEEDTSRKDLLVICEGRMFSTQSSGFAQTGKLKRIKLQEEQLRVSTTQNTQDAQQTVLVKQNSLDMSSTQLNEEDQTEVRVKKKKKETQRKDKKDKKKKDKKDKKHKKKKRKKDHTMA